MLNGLSDIVDHWKLCHHLSFNSWRRTRTPTCCDFSLPVASFTLWVHHRLTLRPALTLHLIPVLFLMLTHVQFTAPSLKTCIYSLIIFTLTHHVVALKYAGRDRQYAGLSLFISSRIADLNFLCVRRLQGRYSLFSDTTATPPCPTVL